MPPRAKRKAPRPETGRGADGAAIGIRTPNLRIRSPMLYPIELWLRGLATCCAMEARSARSARRGMFGPSPLQGHFVGAPREAPQRSCSQGETARWRAHDRRMWSRAVEDGGLAARRPRRPRGRQTQRGDGAAIGIRTPNLRIRSPMLYPIELWLRGSGGVRGIRTLDGLLTHTRLAIEHLRPLGHDSIVGTSRSGGGGIRTLGTCARRFSRPLPSTTRPRLPA